MKIEYQGQRVPVRTLPLPIEAIEQLALRYVNENPGRTAAAYEITSFIEWLKARR